MLKIGSAPKLLVNKEPLTTEASVSLADEVSVR